MDYHSYRYSISSVFLPQDYYSNRFIILFWHFFHRINTVITNRFIISPWPLFHSITTLTGSSFHSSNPSKNPPCSLTSLFIRRDVMDKGALRRPNGSGHLCGLQNQQQNPSEKASHCKKRIKHLAHIKTTTTESHIMSKEQVFVPNMSTRHPRT